MQNFESYRSNLPEFVLISNHPQTFFHFFMMLNFEFWISHRTIHGNIHSLATLGEPAPLLE